MHDHGNDYHNHEHGHSHAYGPGHSHAPANFGRAFAVGITLNAGFVVVETIFGVFSHSLALVADAGHNFSDVLGLILAWSAAYLVKRKPTARHTYGFKRSSVVAAFLNAIFLIGSMGAVAWEAIRRLDSQTPIGTSTVIWVSAVGIVINGITAVMFMSGRKGDMNIRAAFLHMAGDALISAGVVAAGVVITFTHWLWLDPLVSLLIVGLILWGTWSLFRDSLNLSLDAVPSEIDSEKVRAYLKNLPRVKDAHDLHIWALSTTEAALTAHLVIDGNEMAPDLVHEIGHELEEDFGIHHVTIQLEPVGFDGCVTNRCD